MTDINSALDKEGRAYNSTIRTNLGPIDDEKIPDSTIKRFIELWEVVSPKFFRIYRLNLNDNHRDMVETLKVEKPALFNRILRRVA